MTCPRVLLGGLKQLLEILIPLHVLIPSFPPLSHSLAMKDKNVEESIKQQHSLGLNARRIQQHRHRTILIKGITIKRRLNHDQTVAHVLMIKHMSIECRLVR